MKDLQSRREFFKSAAKAALPIIGAVVLANLPVQSQACETSCGGSCEGACKGGCSGGCSGACTGCSHSCESSASRS